MFSWRIRGRRALLIASAGLACVFLASTATPVVGSGGTGPVPPCGSAPVPPHAALDAPLNVQVWFQSELPENWTPPSCTGWQPRPFTVLVGAAGRFENRHGADGIIRRVASISRLTSIDYWSVTRGRWHQLFSDAAALTRPDREARRPDFTTDDLQPGATLYFWQEESSAAGSAVYRLRVRERTPERIVFAVDNVSPVTLALFTLAEAGEYEFLYLLERESADMWRYYSLSRAGSGPVLLAEFHEKSYVNRAVALFRYVAGRATNGEPPAAR